MLNEFISITADNIDSEHLCCIIRTKKPHPGVEAKRKWLSERLGEGHVFRKLNVKGCVFIEYAPLETAWVPIKGDNYLYIYCLWVSGEFKGKGYGRKLLNYCISDAHEKGKSGICILGATKQKAWLTDQAFAAKHGFTVVDSTDSGYNLLALSFDGSMPHFTDSARKCEINSKDLTVFYDMQCPYILQSIQIVTDYCSANGIPAEFIKIDSLQKAKELPCIFNNWAVFYGGKFITVNLLDINWLKRIAENKKS